MGKKGVRGGLRVEGGTKEINRKEKEFLVSLHERKGGNYTYVLELGGGG